MSSVTVADRKITRRPAAVPADRRARWYPPLRRAAPSQGAGRPKPLLQRRCSAPDAELGRHGRDHRTPFGFAHPVAQACVGEYFHLALEHAHQHQNALAVLRIEQLPIAPMRDPMASLSWRLRDTRPKERSLPSRRRGAPATCTRRPAADWRNTARTRESRDPRTSCGRRPSAPAYRA